MAENEFVERFVAAPCCRAAEAPERVPKKPGYYAIFVDDPLALPIPFRELLVQRETKLIYIGIATKSLYERLVEQDLQQRPSTFFRGIGPILDYWPVFGFLVGKKNRNNYTFCVIDTKAICAWICEHLSVSWQEADPAVEAFEKSLINRHAPIINTDDNPRTVPELAALREKCRIIARSINSHPAPG